mgnify:CR=1 FL=1
MKCEYKYKRDTQKKCPHDALPDSKLCFWHEEKDEKDLHGQKLKEKDLADAYLVKANLEDANFLFHAVLFNANLEGANLNSTILKGVYLNNASLKEANLFCVNLADADLTVANLERVDLTHANLQRAELVGAKLEGANFRNTDLRDADLFSAEIIGAKNLRYAKLDGIVINERNGDRRRDKKGSFGNYRDAMDVYVNLKNYFHNDALYDKSSEYYIREQKVRGKILKIASRVEYDEKLIKPPYYLQFFYRCRNRKFFPVLFFLESKTKWIVNRFLSIFSNYGESPFRVLVSSLFIIIIYSILYWGFQGITSGDIKFNPSFLESLYFSIVTFTTLGYGDYHPKPFFQLVATSEAFIGAFMLAFFVVVVSRKIIR